MKPIMDRDEAIGDFLEQYVFDGWQEDIISIQQTYSENQEQIEADFIAAVNRLFKQAARLQEHQLKQDVQYVYFSLLRTRVMEHTAVYRLEVHDDRWVLDPVECVEEWNADFIFSPLFQRMEELHQVRTEYAGKISMMDIERILQIEATRYHLFAVEFMRSMIPAILASSGYNLMRKNTQICILAGEYRDECQVLHGNLEGYTNEGESGGN